MNITTYIGASIVDVNHATIIIEDLRGGWARSMTRIIIQNQLFNIFSQKEIASVKVSGVFNQQIIARNSCKLEIEIIKNHTISVEAIIIPGIEENIFIGKPTLRRLSYHLKEDSETIQIDNKILQKQMV